MALETAVGVPTIDFSGADLCPGSAGWSRVRGQVQLALETYGCFVAVCNKMPTKLRQAVFHSLEELFSFPVETKQSCASSKQAVRMYITNPQIPYFESMRVGETAAPEQVQSFTQLFWPQGNPSFSQAMCSFAERAAELERIVRRMVLESLGVEKYYDSHVASTHDAIRVNKYKGPGTEEPVLVLRPHTDKNILTIHIDNQEGLEVQARDGNWFPVETGPDAIAVLAGDALLAWSNGRVHAPCHHVTMSSAEDRYFAGLFSVPKPGLLVQAPEELIDEDHPMLFKPFDYAEYMKFFMTEQGLRVESPLKAFCGV